MSCGCGKPGCRKSERERTPPGKRAGEDDDVNNDNHKDPKDILLEQILEKMGTLDTMNYAIKELSESSKSQWEVVKEAMGKIDAVCKDLETTRAQVAELRKEIDNMKKSAGRPNLVADPRIEALSEEVKKLKSSTIGGCSTRAGSLPPPSVLAS